MPQVLPLNGKCSPSLAQNDSFGGVQEEVTSGWPDGAQVNQRHARGASDRRQLGRDG